MGHILREDGGEIKFINTNPLEIIDELKESIKWLQSRYDDARETINKMKEDTYKDSELTRLKDEVKRLEESTQYGFLISKEEHDAINDWKQDWINRKKDENIYMGTNGNAYMGTIGGGFIYQFHPTGIGTVGRVIAPDGEDFKFREL